MSFGSLSRGQSRVVADVWEKDVWDFQAKSGSSVSCTLFLHFLGKIAVQKMSSKASGSPRHPSTRHPGLHTDRLRCREREHWILQHFNHFEQRFFGPGVQTQEGFDKNIGGRTNAKEDTCRSSLRPNRLWGHHSEYISRFLEHNLSLFWRYTFL